MFDKSFTEAIETVLNHKGFAVGENFKPGVFLDCNNGVVVLKQRTDGIQYIILGNAVISKGLFDQKYKIIVAATDKALGLA